MFSGYYPQIWLKGGDQMYFFVGKICTHRPTISVTHRFPNSVLMLQARCLHVELCLLKITTKMSSQKHIYLNMFSLLIQ